ncbi:MAG: hypothetical protein LBP37_04195 [Spirochaetaceae bacterium]|nr:hypothetical protein [Spirochaetaceae bacterium]
MTEDRIEGQENEKEETGATFEEQEFYNWCDANDIDRAVDGKDEDERKSFERMKRHFVTAVKEKRLVVDGNKIIYTVSDRSPNAGTELTVTYPNGRAMLAMDGYKDTQHHQKLQAFIAAICGVQKRDIQTIAALGKKDYQLLVDIATLFLVE